MRFELRTQTHSSVLFYDISFSTRKKKKKQAHSLSETLVLGKQF